MKVAIIETTGKIVTVGEWDGKLIDKEYIRVSGQGPYHIAYAYRDEDRLEVSTRLTANTARLKAAHDAHDKEMYAVRNTFMKPRV